MAERRHDAAELAAVLAEDTSRYLRVVDLVLRDVQSDVIAHTISSPEEFRGTLGDAATNQALRDIARELPQASAISLFDASGQLVNFSRTWPAADINVADRDYFQYLRDHDVPLPFLSHVVRNRYNGALTLYMARRIDGPGGTFLGIVVGALDVDYLAEGYAAILAESGESITLLRRDGLVLARYPGNDVSVNKYMPPVSAWYAAVAAHGGTYETPGYIDPTPAIVAVNPVADYGLVVDVVISKDVALAGWHQQRLATVVACLAVIIGIIVLFAVITRQFLRLHKTAEALRASELRLRDFASTASEWFWEQDDALRFTWISQESPVRDPTDVSYIGRTRWEMVGGDLADPAWAAHLQDLEARRPFRNFVYQRVGNDGRRHYVSISGNPVFDDSGGFAGYRGTGREITVTVEAAEELRRARDQAETASRVKSEFLASMTHELRTPLNAIIGFSELIRDQPFGAIGGQYVEYAREIHASGRDLLTVINDVLDMSKIEAGRYEINDEPIDIGVKMADCCAILAPQAEEGHVRLIREDTLVGAVVRADQRAIRQVLLNVLGNAVKFTPAGGTVSMRAELPADGSLVIVVADTGIGIDKAALLTLFEPFQQADSSITRRFGGTGLGLSISRRLMRLHDGAIEIDSVLGEGTTVRIIFPQSRVVAVPSTAQAMR